MTKEKKNIVPFEQMEGLEVSLSDNREIVISGRLLHKFLEIKTRYTEWFKRMVEYGFVENVDFTVFPKIEKDETAFGGTRTIIDHAIKIDMAKEISMIQRTDKGKQARQYFIEVEKKYNSPELIMSRALKMADNKITELSNHVNMLESKIEDDEPKVIFAETLEVSDYDMSVGEFSKVLSQNGYEIGRNRLYIWFRIYGYCMGKRSGEYNLPTQYSIENGWMVIQTKPYECEDGITRVSKTTRITPKGQKYFVNKFIKQYGTDMTLLIDPEEEDL